MKEEKLIEIQNSELEKIAIISDIHGNLEALKATLNDIKRRGIKRIFCLGDIIAKGVHPHECIRLVKENCEVILKGNCDEFFIQDNYPDSLREDLKVSIKWNKSLLKDEDYIFLNSLPFSYEFYLSGSLVRLFHATPNTTNGFVSSIDSLETNRKQFMPSKNTLSSKLADIVIYGHTHMCDLDRMYNRTLINVGSVGNSIDAIRNPLIDANPLETTQAYYLIIEGVFNSLKKDVLSYQFVRVPYDILKELESSKNILEYPLLEKELKEGIYRDIPKLKNYFANHGINMDDF